MPIKIAIVDDEPDILKTVSFRFRREGFNVESFTSADALFRDLEKGYTPELIILDIMMPGIDGFEACKRLKADDSYSSIPVIMLTAKSEENFRVRGLEMGADDYVVKPFSSNELVARVRALLRRMNNQRPSRRLKIDENLLLDLDRQEVILEGKKIYFTTVQFRLLALLAKRRGFVLTRDMILEHLWGNEKVVIDRTVDVHIRNIRRKLGRSAKLIINVRGEGYKLVE